LIHPAEILILDRSGDEIGLGCNSMTLIKKTQTDDTETYRTNTTMGPYNGSHEILLQSRIKDDMPAGSPTTTVPGWCELK
jgi:hypothetical protein